MLAESNPATLPCPAQLPRAQHAAKYSLHSRFLPPLIFHTAAAIALYTAAHPASPDRMAAALHSDNAERCAVISVNGCTRWNKGTAEMK